MVSIQYSMWFGKMDQKDERVTVDMHRVDRMLRILLKNGFSEQDLFNLTLLLLLDMAISDASEFDKLFYFIKDTADYFRAKGVKSVFEDEFK
jgi:hypothetical protein